MIIIPRTIDVRIVMLHVVNKAFRPAKLLRLYILYLFCLNMTSYMHNNYVGSACMTHVRKYAYTVSIPRQHQFKEYLECQIVLFSFCRNPLSILRKLFSVSMNFTIIYICGLNNQTMSLD